MLTPVDTVAERRTPVRRGPFYEFACQTIDEFLASDMELAEVTGWPHPPKGSRRVLRPEPERVAAVLRDRAHRLGDPVVVRQRGGRIYVERSGRDEG